MAFRATILSWGADHHQDLPWRGNLPIWLGLVTEILLQRTRASQVVPVFKEFRRRYKSAKEFSEAGREEIVGLIAPLGLRWRAPLLYELAQQLSVRSGRVPLDLETLQTLPGIGPYSASATLSLHANRRAVIIDSNIVRVLCRITGKPYDGETRRKRWIWDLAQRLTPDQGFKEYNYALLDFSMIVCRPKSPRCKKCPLLSMCRYGLSSSSRRSVAVVSNSDLEAS